MELQIIIAGVGGQGVLFATEILSQSSLDKRHKTIGSETHGMAQRGGSVVSHLKIGNFLGPLVRRGTADILYSFEKTETYRTLPFLKRQGVCFVNAPADTRWGTEIEKHLNKQKIKICSLNADQIALEMKAPLVANLILIGFSIASGCLPFTQADIEGTIKKIAPSKFLELNLKAFRTGYEAGQSQITRPRRR